MHIKTSSPVAVVLAGTAVLSLASSKPATAQNLTYTLDNVAFNDGAIASGYFEYNPTSNTFGDYNITTTDGATDALIGATQKPGTDTVYYLGYPNLSISSFSFIAYQNDLILETHNLAVSSGVYALTPGIVTDPYYLGHSGEFAPTAGSTSLVSTARPIVTGSLVVTEAVPEAATTVSLGLLLTLGLGGAAVAARKKKSAV